ncbi:peroxisomal membrane protein PEX14-like [Lineus longissimus]|uniref:peroxisomal membrane protein PEX14-like n=1 Tax=Lineus longissimus TaxID=88925 RepID=UPI00315D2E8B
MMTDKQRQLINIMEKMSSPNIRENLVNTAVKFLQNPKVQESPLGQKRLFLEKKGLTNEEIDLALERSGTSPDNTVINSSQQLVATPLPVSVVIPSPWSRFKDVSFTVALIGGATYAIYKFIKKTLLPYLRGEDSTETRLKKIEKNLSQVQNNMTDILGKMSTTLISIEAIMSQQQEKLQVVVHEVVDKQNTQSLVKYQDQQNSTEIKAEIASLKSLLLNRRQFAAPPQNSPIIPAWQREVKKETDDTTPKRSHSEETSPSNGNESSGSLEEKSSWVKIDASDRVSGDDSGEDVKSAAPETGTNEVDSVVGQEVSADENVPTEGASLTESENMTANEQ